MIAPIKYIVSKDVMNSPNLRFDIRDYILQEFQNSTVFKLTKSILPEHKIKRFCTLNAANIDRHTFLYITHTINESSNMYDNSKRIWMEIIMYPTRVLSISQDEVKLTNLSIPKFITAPFKTYEKEWGLRHLVE
jgi:hypothetical protein